MRLSNTIRLLVLLACARGISAQTYTTTFPLTENPISESGKWINGGVTGLDWGNVRTTTNLAFGASTSVGCPGTVALCNDPSAVLSGTWPSAQAAQATVFVDATLGTNCCHEVELRLNVTITAHSITGYEINCSTSQNNYFQLVRWNGPLGSFTQLASVSPGCAQGDVITATHSATGVITAYKNGVQQFQITDTTYMGGSPGMGFFDNLADGKLALSGFTKYSAYVPNACPSAANYTSPTNPTGSLVTLASLGITKCSFIAANGSNSNDGASEVTPWLFSPGMNACSVDCTNSAITAGAGFIFRGGDTWHFGNSGASPYAGVVTACATNGTVAGGLCMAGSSRKGTSANPIYIGVDKSWFTGGSWARPILTADNPACNALLVNGTTCLTSGITGLSGAIQYYVNACTYQVGTANILTNFNDAGFQIFDNLELSGLCAQAVGQPNGANTFVRYSTLAGPNSFLNLYIHNATHLQFAGFNGGPNCTVSTVCFNLFAFQGRAATANPGENILLNAVDFSDSDGSGAGLLSSGGYNVAYNYIGSTSQALPNTAHLFHDNLYENFFENGHSNMIESAEVAGTNAIYNNVFRHVDTTGATGSVMLWPGPVANTDTDYIFNNLGYDVASVQYLNNGGVGITTNNGNYKYFNNTWQSNVNQPILRINGTPLGTVTDTNNHYITDGSPYNLGSPGSWTAAKPLLMTNSVATATGYTSSQTFAFAPTSGGSPTVGVGNNVTSTLCAALTTAAGSDATLADAAAACGKDTRYACTYNSTTHTNTCPARTTVARPVSTPWDIGAYESPVVNGPIATFCSPTVSLGLAPFGLAGNPVACSLTNTGASNLVNTQIALSSNSFFVSSNTCGSPATITTVIPGTGFTLTPGQSCTFNVVFQPQAVGFQSGVLGFTENTIGLVDFLALNGTGTGTPAPCANCFAGTMTSQGTVKLK